MKKVKEIIEDIALPIVRSMTGTKLYSGMPAEEEMDNILPIGLSKVSVDRGTLSFAYLDNDGNTLIMFALEQGVHNVHRPVDVTVVVSCTSDCSYGVRHTGRFDPADPNRTSVTVRPLTQRQEMQDYFNELVARVSSREMASKLRSGEVEFDYTQENYDDDLEDDYDSPLSVEQMSIIVDQITADLKSAQNKDHSPAKPTSTNDKNEFDSKQMDIEEQTDVPEQPVQTKSVDPTS